MLHDILTDCTADDNVNINKNTGVEYERIIIDNICNGRDAEVPSYVRFTPSIGDQV